VELFLWFPATAENQNQDEAPPFDACNFRDHRQLVFRGEFGQIVLVPAPPPCPVFVHYVFVEFPKWWARFPDLSWQPLFFPGPNVDLHPPNTHTWSPSRKSWLRSKLLWVNCPPPTPGSLFNSGFSSQSDLDVVWSHRSSRGFVSALWRFSVVPPTRHFPFTPKPFLILTDLRFQSVTLDLGLEPTTALFFERDLSPYY